VAEAPVSSSAKAQDPDPVPIKEVDALMRYVASNGIDADGKILGPLHEVMAQVATEPARATTENRKKLLTYYASLTRLTQPVTGKSLLDSVGLDRHIRSIQNWCYFVLATVALSTALKAWLGDQPEPEEGWLLWVLMFNRYVLDFLSPFLWGALGSYVYLLKRFSDLAADRKFDRDLLQGWETRVILGAVLGGVAQFLYDSAVFTSSGLQLDANALGFLTGVGVKVVYGAIEKTIDALGSAMNLDALRTAGADTASVRRYLNEQLEKLGASEGDEQKKETILTLLSELKDSKKPI